MIFDWLKTLPQYLLPKQSLTILAGIFANVQNPKVKNWLITRFIKAYGVNMTEALVEEPTAYSCFNDFFIRHLKPEARPIANSDFISPVDGVVSEMGAIRDGQVLQAKGRYYSVQQLLSSTAERAQAFKNGQFMTLYLSPKDYHRVHLPLAASLQTMTHVPGALFSVQPTTVRVVPHLFARNERLVMDFETGIGSMAMVMVGATIVGAMGTSWEGELKRNKAATPFLYDPCKPMQKAAEVGYFKLGSTVILLFAEGSKIQWASGIAAGSPVCFGQSLGALLPD